MKIPPKDAAQLLITDLRWLGNRGSEKDRTAYLRANAPLIRFFLSQIKEQFTKADLNELREKYNLAFQGSTFIIDDEFSSMERTLNVGIEENEIYTRRGISSISDYALENLKRAMEYVQCCSNFPVEEVELLLHPAESMSLLR